MQDFQRDRANAIEWARDLLADDGRNWLVLDTETTGLGPQAEPVQICITDARGIPLLNTLVKPTRTITSAATAVHGIINDDVRDAPNFEDIYPNLLELLFQRRVIIYNAEFDTRILEHACQLAHLEPIPLSAMDAMFPYSRFVGDWNPRHNDYRWQPLPSAGHTALADCLAVLAIIKEMAGAK